MHILFASSSPRNTSGNDFQRHGNPVSASKWVCALSSAGSIHHVMRSFSAEGYFTDSGAPDLFCKASKVTFLTFRFATP